MDENKIKSYLGFAIRSRKAIFGYDNLFTTKKMPLLTLISSTQGDKMKEKVIAFCLDKKIRCIRLPFALEDVLGRNCKVISILDSSLANAIYNELKMEN